MPLVCLINRKNSWIINVGVNCYVFSIDAACVLLHIYDFGFVKA